MVYNIYNISFGNFIFIWGFEIVSIDQQAWAWTYWKASKCTIDKPWDWWYNRAYTGDNSLRHVQRMNCSILFISPLLSLKPYWIMSCLLRDSFHLFHNSWKNLKSWEVFLWCNRATNVLKYPKDLHWYKPNKIGWSDLQ